MITYSQKTKIKDVTNLDVANILTNQVSQLEEEIKQLRKRCSELESWQRRCRADVMPTQYDVAPKRYES